MSATNPWAGVELPCRGQEAPQKRTGADFGAAGRRVSRASAEQRVPEGQLFFERRSSSALAMAARVATLRITMPAMTAITGPMPSSTTPP
jgi:hypothetical protein